MTYRNFLLGGVALAGVLASGLAHSQETGWGGAFVGADIGLGMGATPRDQIDPLFGITDRGSLGSEGPVGGIFAGYDVEVSPGLVFGIEAGLDFFNAEANSTASTPLEDFEFRSLGAAYAGIRAGAEVAPRTLAYGRLAYAAIHAESSEALPFIPATQDFLDGYHAAIGLETEVMDNVSIRVEGTYTQALEPLVSGEDEYEHTPSHLGATVGVSYRFGGPGRGPRVDIEPTRSWDGGYVGVLAGPLATSTINGGLVDPPQEGPVSTITGQYGAYAGVNIQIGDQWVAGVEGELVAYDAVYDAVNVADESWNYASSDLKGQVSARFGYLANPDTLIYARAGYGLMRVNPDYGFAFEDSEPEYLQTVSAGLGVETMVTPNIVLRAEGLYNTALESYRFDDLTNLGDEFYYVKPNSVEARVGAAFMF